MSERLTLIIIITFLQVQDMQEQWNVYPSFYVKTFSSLYFASLDDFRHRALLWPLRLPRNILLFLVQFLTELCKRKPDNFKAAEFFYKLINKYIFTPKGPKPTLIVFFFLRRGNNCRLCSK